MKIATAGGDRQEIFVEGLDRPHGLAYAEGRYYVAETNRVIRVRDDDGDGKADEGSMQTVVDQILTDSPGGGHWTRSLAIRNGTLFVSAGSSCNACIERDERRAAITACDLDGKNCGVYASGLRNSVGMAVRPETGGLYATENGRDFLGDELPSEEINAVEEGKQNYGWPYCYGKNAPDADFGEEAAVFCNGNATPPAIELPAHNAPLGLAFYGGGQFPPEYRGRLFVALHGSWNRQTPDGYKVVSVDLESKLVEDFATGFLDGIVVRGRPVDVQVAADGSLLVSDDNGGRIYRISYAP